MSEAVCDWTGKRVDAASESTPVDATAVAVLKAELLGTMRERPLRPPELIALATQMLATDDAEEERSS